MIIHYIDFIPLFISTWKKLYPLVDVKVILIMDHIPNNLIIYQDHLILFPPLKNISTAFISQYIRILYPAILNYSNGILITDIDMIPMNKTYYTKNIENISNDKFISLRDVLLEEYKQIAICYNVALNKTWSDIFKINNLDDIINTLQKVYNSINYIDGHGESGWCKDQIDLYHYVMNWRQKTNNYIALSDSNTGYYRLDRYQFSLNLDTDTINKITNGLYSDYHLYRPMSHYIEVNIRIYNLLTVLE